MASLHVAARWFSPLWMPKTSPPADGVMHTARSLAAREQGNVLKNFDAGPVCG
ncbi:MAG: hypothetical protein IJU37_06065 [Desulfovibrio sp.]|nr:hypothetical protein [Desulfovibrio sp.]